MRPEIQKKIDELNRMAEELGIPPENMQQISRVQNSLASVIRTERDAQVFMASIKAAIDMSEEQLANSR